MIKKKKKEEYQESSWVLEIAYIMRVGQGPFTKLMLIAELEHLHPRMYHQELKREIESAFSDDKYNNKPQRFKQVKPGWWDLAERS
jgi:hypothetical protein